MVTTVFVDTNILLHYRPLEEVDWLSLARTDRVTLVILPIVQRQLDRHKESHHRKAIRRRAGRVLSALKQFFTSEIEVELRRNVRFRFEVIEPALDFEANRLRPDVEDDYLLASVIEAYSRQGQDVAIATDDIGLMLKARRHGIAAIQMPEALRLAEEQDPDEKRIQDLESKLHKLETAQPALKVCFEDRADRLNVDRPQPFSFSDQELREKLAVHMKGFPRAVYSPPVPPALPPGTPPSLVRLASIAPMLPRDLPAPSEVARYNNDLVEYAAQYERYLRKWRKYHELQRRMFRLDLFLANNGTAPAEDVHVFLIFGDNVTVTHSEGMPRTPKEPTPPHPPRPLIEMVARDFGAWRPFIPDPIDFTPRNVSRPIITRDGGVTAVEIHVERVKHRFAEALGPLYVVFGASAAVRSFNIGWRINAGNVPDQIEGRVHVIVHGGEAQTEADQS